MAQDEVPPAIPSAPSDRSAHAAFWELWQAHRAELDAEVEVAVRKIPVFAQILESMTAEQRAASEQVSRRLEQAALVQGDWEPLREHLIAQGELYAGMGIPLEDWQLLLVLFRDGLRGKIEEAHPADPDARLELSKGMDRYVDWAMGTIAVGYVTERQKQVDRATGELTLFRDLFDHASVGMEIYATDRPSGGVVLRAVNPVARALHGSELEVGKTAPDDARTQQLDLLDHLREVQGTRAAAHWEATDLDDRGVPRHFSLRAFPLADAHVGIILEDVSAKKRLELARMRALEDLARSNRELDHFAYVASHDLKAPLRDVDNLASWIEEDVASDLPEDSRRHFAQLRARVVRMERLLDDLLQYSRVGRMQHRVERFSSADVVQAAVEQVGVPEAFDVECEGDAVDLVAPRVPLEQVLRNLVDNAIKHHGGSKGRITICTRTRKDSVYFSVRDDGAGIAPEYHERIFAMFQTLRPRDEAEGSGMGLALVKKIVTGYGGTIGVKSRPGTGSQFSFTWPREWSDRKDEVR